MGKDIIRQSNDPTRDEAGLEVLRSVANYPHRAVEMHKHQYRNRVVITQRDAFGNVIGSVERIEETETTDLTGQWTD